MDVEPCYLCAQGGQPRGGAHTVRWERGSILDFSCPCPQAAYDRDVAMVRRLFEEIEEEIEEELGEKIFGR